MYDVAIIGGGPAGSTCGTLLKLYNADLNVVILEREKFPRDHVGESLLPALSILMDEMHVWDKVESAGFPVKIGATYRWGSTPDLWDLEFIPSEVFTDEDRPGSFEGLRTFTAFQVDRSIFDKVLLDHAASLGCEVREETRVVEVGRDGDKVTGLTLEDGSRIEARHYVDASGVSGTLRRKMDVPIDSPTTLRNIAIWDYWQNAEWAVEIGVDGTRILILSVDYGWLWFIPLSPTRTSVGLVVPVDYYKKTGKTPEELYVKALEDEPLLRKLMSNADREHHFFTTNDWSYIADRLYGDNWFLAGDACGFADPILSAGLTLAMTGAKQVAYSLLAILDGEHDAQWLKRSYDETQRNRIRQHVRFADMWYGANGQFSDLRDMTREIAASAGLTLDADDAFRWLATGGFAYDDPSSPILGGFALPAIKVLNQRLTQKESTWLIGELNMFRLNLEGAVQDTMPVLFNGQISVKPCYRRGNKLLPEYGFYAIAIGLLRKHQNIEEMLQRLQQFFIERPIGATPDVGIDLTMAALEAMVAEGWVIGEYDPNYDLFDFSVPEETSVIHANRDISRAVLDAI